MSEISPQPDEQTGIRVVPSMEVGDTPVFYANHVQVTFTPEDFTIHLGWYVVPPFGQQPPGITDVPVKSLAKVVIPLNLVRGLINALDVSAKSWEGNWGELPVHPNPPAQTPSPAERTEG